MQKWKITACGGGSKSRFELVKEFSIEEAAAVRRFHRGMTDYYAPTALVGLPGRAASCRVAGVFVKDESTRFGLKAFKALGASFAVGRLLAERLGCDLDFGAVSAALKKARDETLTLATTTDGNHGRGVAWVAKVLGLKAVVYMPAGSAEERVRAIEGEGARVKVTTENYDDTVRLLAAEAKRQGWLIVQDTAWQGYEEVPRRIMQGYMTMAAEAVEQIPQPPTHVFLQAGVGSMAAGVMGFLSNYYQGRLPRFVILEPQAADCVFRSYAADRAVAVGGEMQTISAGLACGEVNPLAWPILREFGDYALSLDDSVAAEGMRLLAKPVGEDAAVTAGESGAIGGGVLKLLAEDASLREQLGINEASVLLFFNTEGATSPTRYREIVEDNALPWQEEEK